jgi:hypothetical protein
VFLIIVIIPLEERAARRAGSILIGASRRCKAIPSQRRAEYHGLAFIATHKRRTRKHILISGALSAVIKKSANASARRGGGNNALRVAKPSRDRRYGAPFRRALILCGIAITRVCARHADFSRPLVYVARSRRSRKPRAARSTESASESSPYARD